MITEWSRQPTAIRSVVIVCVVLEALALTAQMAGFVAQVRNVMIALGGFWPGMLEGGRPEFYPGQSILMFATSAVLHGGLLHLFMNMVGLMWLGPMVIERVGDKAFLPIMGLSALGAGLFQTLLGAGNGPVVGASGVLFGLVGVLGTWELLDRIRLRRELRTFAQQALALLAVNVAFALLAGGVVAWQAHLGGLVAGCLCGGLTWRRRPV